MRTDNKAKIKDKISNQSVAESKTIDHAPNNMFDDVFATYFANDRGDEEVKKIKQGYKKRTAETRSKHMLIADRNINALKLAGIEPSLANDIEQILHIKSLVKFFFFRELSGEKGNQKKRQKRFEEIINSLDNMPAPKMREFLEEYFALHKDSEKQRNILSSVILVSYLDNNEIEHTEPYKISGTTKPYNTLDTSDPKFHALVQESHASTRKKFAITDNHTEAALVVMLQNNIDNIKAKYGPKITRISLGIDSLYSGCNHCVDKIQSLRMDLLDNIRLSISFNYSVTCKGDMGRLPVTQDNANDEESSAKRSKINYAAILASPIVTSNAPPLDPRDTKIERSPSKTAYHNDVDISATTFVSGSAAPSASDTIAIKVLNDFANPINNIEAKMLSTFFTPQIEEVHQQCNNFVDAITASTRPDSPVKL